MMRWARFALAGASRRWRSSVSIFALMFALNGSSFPTGDDTGVAWSRLQANEMNGASLLVLTGARLLPPS